MSGNVYEPVSRNSPLCHAVQRFLTSPVPSRSLDTQFTGESCSCWSGACTIPMFRTSHSGVSLDSDPFIHSHQTRSSGAMSLDDDRVSWFLPVSVSGTAIARPSRGQLFRLIFQLDEPPRTKQTSGASPSSQTDTLHPCVGCEVPPTVNHSRRHL